MNSSRLRVFSCGLGLLFGSPLFGAEKLSQADVELLLARGVAAATREGLHATVVVTDREANVLGAVAMLSAPKETRIAGERGRGLQGLSVPSLFAAISKAGTASFFATSGNAFTPRTAGFIVQQHFPPSVERQPGGPLFGVQFSSLPCTDVTVPLGAAGGYLPLGLSADPGAVPLYKNGEPVGGIGIEGDGAYTFDPSPLAAEEDRPLWPEERAAVTAAEPFAAPKEIRANEILVNGIRLPFTDVESLPDVSPSGAPGSIQQIVPPHDPPPSRFAPRTLGGVSGFVLVEPDGKERFPIRASASAQGLTADDVQKILSQGAVASAKTRAAIRRPIGSASQVSVAVVDVDGTILGLFRTQDAPIFGVDVSAQKARTAAFFTSPGAGAALNAGHLEGYVTAAARDGVRLDGSVAFTDRGNGFLSRPFFPDGIDGTEHGPFSKPIAEWSPFNVGLQLDLIQPELERLVDVFLKTGTIDNSRACSAVPGTSNGIQIFAGSLPLFKNGAFVGAVGVSGDGIDQDDWIASSASLGFATPPDRRCDRLFVRGVRLPWQKYPRHPNL